MQIAFAQEANLVNQLCDSSQYRTYVCKLLDSTKERLDFLETEWLVTVPAPRRLDRKRFYEPFKSSLSQFLFDCLLI